MKLNIICRFTNMLYNTNSQVARSSIFLVPFQKLKIGSFDPKSKQSVGIDLLSQVAKGCQDFFLEALFSPKTLEQVYQPFIYFSVMKKIPSCSPPPSMSQVLLCSRNGSWARTGSKKRNPVLSIC